MLESLQCIGRHDFLDLQPHREDQPWTGAAQLGEYEASPHRTGRLAEWRVC